MRLSRLIRDRRESILQEFEDFARTHTVPGAEMDIAALRNHAAGMLEAIAHDLEQPQTDRERDRKALGEAPRSEDPAVTAAEEHGVQRARSGFSLDEAVAEYRALRASVLRHWTETISDSPEAKVRDIIRFNESIDQSITESLREYSKTVSGYREMSLAVLGHDLRSPLDGIMNAATFLADTEELSDQGRRLAGVIQRSGKRMKDLIADLLDLTSVQLGQGMRIHPSEVNLGEIAQEVVRISEAAHPDREFRLRRDGDLAGEYDPRRIHQVLSNLLDNAVRHGAPDSPITVTVAADGDAEEDVLMTVHNFGPAIPAVEREQIFQPFRHGAPKTDESATSMGLGLYIARQAVEAHGGRLEVESDSDEGTTFSLRIPRRQSR